VIKDLEFSTFFPFITSNKICVIDFYAEWCVPCQRMMKILPRLDESIKDVASIGKIDTDKEVDLKGMFEVKKIPTFIFFKDGKEISRCEGRIMTLAEIEETVRRLTK
jgi:thioredoxin 1